MEKKKLPKIQYDKVSSRRKIVKPHTHNYYELYYLVSGQTAYFVGDEIYQLMPGDFIIVPEGVIHSTDSQTCLHNERLLVTFYGDIFDFRIKEYLDDLCSQRLIHIKEGYMHVFEQLLQKMQDEGDITSPLGILYVLELVLLLSRHKSNYDADTKKTDGVTEQIISYIRKNFAEDITLESLSERFLMSESALSRKFKSEAGIGISKFITQVRIFNAEKILLEKNMNITKTAELCGFSDSNYFATVFKKIKGVTPLKYKKEIRTKNEKIP